MADVAESVEGKWQSLLQSKKRLERERGLAELKVLVEGGKLGDEGERREREGQILELVTSLTCPWEAKHGGVMAACILLTNASEEFYEKLKGEVPLLLEHNESRIRISAGTYIHCTCTQNIILNFVLAYMYVHVHVLHMYM